MAKANWALDTAHSSVDFSIKHMVFAKVKGSFEKFDAKIEADVEDLTTANIEFTIDVASIDTRNADRDNHLRAADFFDVEKYPQITFKSEKIIKAGGGYDITGSLTMHGVTRNETFHAEFTGQGKDPWGNEKAGFAAEGKINRSDYGLKYNAALETGGLLIGEEVQISIELQAAKQA